MKNTVKTFGSIILTASMIIGMTGCSALKALGKSAKAALKMTQDITEGIQKGKASKITDYLDEDDDDYDAQCEMIESFNDALDEELDFSMDDYDFEVKKLNSNSKNGEGTAEFVFEIDGEEYEFSFDYEVDGEDVYIADNEEFIVDYFTLFFDVMEDLDEDELNDFLEEGYQKMGVTKNSKLAQETYDSGIEFFSNK